jgi:hypoxanthine phosphoribosyltransferase
MHEFHFNRAKALLEHAEEIVDPEGVQAAVRRVAERLNERFGDAGQQAFPLLLGVMGGAVVFAGNLLPQLTFPLEFDYIHVTVKGKDRRRALSHLA